MEWNFIEHTSTGKRFEERITITKNNVIGLPTQFYNDNNVSTYKYVVLFYDGGNKAVGVTFTNDVNAQGKISITKNNQGYGGHIVATSFFKANKIDTKRFSGRYEYDKQPLRSLGLDRDGEMYIVKLVEKRTADAA